MFFSKVCIECWTYQRSWLHSMINMTSGYLTQGCHCQRKVWEKQKIFKVREKSGKILDIVKVSEKFREFCLPVYSSWVFFDTLKCINFHKRWKVCCKASTAINLTLYAWHTPVCSRCGQWFSFWMPSSKFLLPLTRKAERGWKWREKYWQPAK